MTKKINNTFIVKVVEWGVEFPRMEERRYKGRVEVKKGKNLTETKLKGDGEVSQCRVNGNISGVQEMLEEKRSGCQAGEEIVPKL